MKFLFRLKRKHSFAAADQLREIFPQLKTLKHWKVEEKMIEHGIDIYEERSEKHSFLIRLSMPFGLVWAIFLLIFSPINYFITGRWGYRKMRRTENWFRRIF